MTLVYTVDADERGSGGGFSSKLHLSRTGDETGVAVCSRALVLNYPEDWAIVGTPNAPASELCRRCFKKRAW